jgi:HSP20 family protein
MSMQPTEPRGTRGTAAPESAIPVPRMPRDLIQLLWGGWPFSEVAAPFRDMEAPAGVPIRVEEVIENDQVVIRAELPGIDPEKDIEVTIDEGVLTIKAERRQDREEKTERGYRTEFQYGKFVRQVRLPKGTTAEVVSAGYRDGVLEVRMPAPVAGPAGRRIQVERG